MWDIVKKVRWQDFYHGQFVVQAKNLLQGDSMAYQMDAADANVVLNPFVTAAAQKGIFFYCHCPTVFATQVQVHVAETLGLP